MEIFKLLGTIAVNKGEVIADLREVEDEADKTGKSMQKSFQDAAKKLDSASKSVTDAGKSLSTKVTAPVLALGGAILKTTGDFEQGMNKVAAISGATADEFGQLREQAKELGATTQYSASDAADAMGFLAMAGFDATQILAAMPGTLQLAASAQMDLGRAADIVTNILTGYGLQVEQLGHANDVLVKAMTSSNVDLQMLGESMKYVGPVASNMGFAFEEVAAAVGLLGNAGIQGSMAGTSLRKIMSSLSNPTNTAAERMEKLGVNVYDTSGKLLPLVDIIREFEEAGAQASDMLVIFGDRGGPAMAALVDQGAAALSNLTKELENSGGTAQRIADVQMQGFKGGLEELKSAAEGLMIEIGESGLIQWATDAANAFARWISKLSETDPALLQLITKIAMAAAVIGPLLIGLGMLIKVVAIGASGLGMLSGAFSFLLSPIGLIVAAVAGLIALLVWLWNTNEKFRDAVIAIWEGIKAVFSVVFEAIKDIVMSTWETIGPWLTALWEDLKVVAEWIFGLLQAFWEDWGGAIMTYLGAVWDQIKLTFETVWSLIADIWGLLMAVLRGDWEEAWNRIKSIGETIWNWIKGTFENLATALGAIWEGLGNTLSRIWNWIKDTTTNVWKGIVNGILRFINGIIDGVNLMIKALNSIQVTAPDWVPVIGGKSFGFNLSLLANVPYLETGTNFVPRDMLAFLHKGEAVVPREFNPAAGGALAGAGGVTLNLHVHGNVYGVDDLMEEAVAALRRRTALR